MRRKWMTMMLAVCLLVSASAAACAAGVTLRTFTPFADMDFAAQGYMDMITAWEETTGNVVEDYSGVMDEMWWATLGGMLQSGEADVVVLPPASSLTVQELVTVGEMMQALPEGGVRRMGAMTEADGSVLLSPVRLYWEALYVNTDVLARYGLSAPQTFEQLMATCALLAQSGVLPIANALCEWSEIVLDCAALSGAPAPQYGQEASLAGAKDVLTMLAQVGAFGSDPWNMTDMDAEAAFLEGRAAMRIDADVLAQLIDPARAENVVVVNLPRRDGQTDSAVVGNPAFGVSITRSCWQDAARRAAALDFVRALLGNEALVTPVQGALGASIVHLTAQAQDMTGILYDLNPDGFDSWAEGVVAHLMGM